MRIFGKSKVDRLLLRLFGSDCNECMNMGDITGLLTTLRDTSSSRREDLRELINSIEARVKALESKKKSRAKKK